MLGERHYCLLDGHCTMHVLTTVPCADRTPIRVCPQALSFFRKCRPSATRTRSPDPSSSADHHRDSSTPFAAAACPVATVCWCHIYLKASRASSSSSRVLRSSSSFRQLCGNGRAGHRGERRVSAARTRPDKSSPDGDRGPPS